MRATLLFVLLSATAAAACSSDPASSSSGSPAPSSSVDPGDDVDPVDPDGGSSTKDGGTGKDGASQESGTPGEILGTLSGSCGIVKTLLTSPSPGFEKNQLVFVAGDTYDKASLSDGGDTIYDTPNAGGSSVESEVMSFEVLHACEGASLLKTETQIGYYPADGGPASITDILVSIDGKKVGVSVTRAYKPSNQSYPDSDVKALLEKKLEGIVVSSGRVKPADKWVKQILHVFTANKAASDAVARVLPTIDASLRADTVVLLTQTTGGGFIYCNPDPPLGSECP